MDDGAFSASELEEIRNSIKEKYIRVSTSASSNFKYTTGKAGAISLQYDAEVLNTLSEDFLNSFCGVGNPFLLSELNIGTSILDLGCGAGFDLVVARGKVGDSGKVCGVDLSQEMIDRARKNLQELGFDDVEIALVASEALPYEESSFDVVISNGVINLSPQKLQLFRELHRVLKDGGTLQFADIMFEDSSYSQNVVSVASWAQ